MESSIDFKGGVASGGGNEYKETAVPVWKETPSLSVFVPAAQSATMNILGWEFHFRRSRAQHPSAFAAVLPTVRSMREGRAWPVGAPAVGERQRRIDLIRRRIVYRPISHERSDAGASASTSSSRLWMRWV